MKDVRFDNPRLARAGVEAMTLQQLRERAGHLLGVAERTDFYLLLLVQSGRGSHAVDFVDHPLRAGCVLLVRPGQAHRWRITPSLQGELVLVSAEALAPTRLLALDEWPAVGAPGAALFEEALRDAARLRADIERFGGSEMEVALVRHEVLVLLHRLARGREVHTVQPASREAEIHRLFVRELEAGFHKRLSVLDYARRIGYSESTLSRACVAMTGHTAKQAIDLRIALEAKRLLVHGDATVAGIGHRLGFSEPTNFVKFFRRMAGITPQAFRAR